MYISTSVWQMMMNECLVVENDFDHTTCCCWFQCAENGEEQISDDFWEPARALKLSLRGTVNAHHRDALPSGEWMSGYVRASMAYPVVVISPASTVALAAQDSVPSFFAGQLASEF